MSRSAYIYLVGLKGDDPTVLAAFTVKHEAHKWVKHSNHNPDDLELTRMTDNPRGTRGCASREIIPWDWRLLLR